MGYIDLPERRKLAPTPRPSPYRRYLRECTLRWWRHCLNHKLMRAACEGWCDMMKLSYTVTNIQHARKMLMSYARNWRNNFNDNEDPAWEDTPLVSGLFNQIMAAAQWPSMVYLYRDIKHGPYFVLDWTVFDRSHERGDNPLLQKSRMDEESC